MCSIWSSQSQSRYNPISTTYCAHSLFWNSRHEHSSPVFISLFIHSFKLPLLTFNHAGFCLSVLVHFTVQIFLVYYFVIVPMHLHCPLRINVFLPFLPIIENHFKWFVFYLVCEETKNKKKNCNESWKKKNNKRCDRLQSNCVYVLYHLFFFMLFSFAIRIHVSIALDGKGQRQRQ